MRAVLLSLSRDARNTTTRYPSSCLQLYQLFTSLRCALLEWDYIWPTLLAKERVKILR